VRPADLSLPVMLNDLSATCDAVGNVFDDEDDVIVVLNVPGAHGGDDRDRDRDRDQDEDDAPRAGLSSVTEDEADPSSLDEDDGHTVVDDDTGHALREALLEADGAVGGVMNDYDDDDDDGRRFAPPSLHRREGSDSGIMDHETCVNGGETVAQVFERAGSCFTAAYAELLAPFVCRAGLTHVLLLGSADELRAALPLWTEVFPRATMHVIASSALEGVDPVSSGALACLCPVGFFRRRSPFFPCACPSNPASFPPTPRRSLQPRVLPSN
jgi:hypothetical protein